MHLFPELNRRLVLRLAAALTLAALSLTVFQGQSQIDGIHEVRVIETAREMLELDDWIVPRFAGELRLEKPPLPYWISTLSYKLAGAPSVAAARFAVAGLGLLMLLSVWAIARADGSARMARLAVLILAGFLLFNSEFRKVTTDPFLAAWTSAAIAGFAWAHRLRGRRAAACLALAYLFLSLALLAKGPIALTFVAIGAFFVRPREGGRDWHWHGLGLLLACLPLIAWALLVSERLPDAVSLWRHEVLGRVTGEVEEVRSRWFYFPALLAAAVPLLLPFFAALLRGLRGRDRFALWLTSGLVFLMILSSRKAAYLLPLTAPASLLTARYLDRIQAFREAAWLVHIQFVVNLLLTAALLGAALAWRDHLSWGAGAMAALLVLAAGTQIRQASRGRLRVAALAAGGVMITTFYNGTLLAHLPEEHTLHNLGAYINEHVPRHAVLYQQGGNDPRLSFVINRLPAALDDSMLCATQTPAWLIRRGPLTQASACGWQEILATQSGKSRQFHLYRRD
jgi:4-amino-4-deoxy-L-arabinose transferase-like glycosyltransferase